MNARITVMLLSASALAAMMAGQQAHTPPKDAPTAPAVAAHVAVDAPLAATSTVAAVADKPLQPYQIELLDAAFTAASSLPLNPHMRNRSRAQEVVVTACFTLEQPQRALRYSQQIANWIRGSCYADYALYCAQRGASADIQQYLDQAFGLVQGDEEWRRHIIFSKAAQTYVWLGQTEKASTLEGSVADAEIGKVNIARASRLESAEFDKLMASLSALAATNTFDALRNACASYLRLLDRFYSDESRRTLIQQRLRNAAALLPTMVQVEIMTAQAESAVSHDDGGGALQLINEAQATINGRKWQTNDRLPMEARLARLRWMAGEQESARRDADALVATYDSERDRITDIYRAETLSPIAECYRAMGDNAAALEMYRRAVEEGIANPNQWPRAVDLSETCCSMALCGVEPDADLWKRIREIGEGLNTPW